jgi:hypothetical protein
MIVGKLFPQAQQGRRIADIGGRIDIGDSATWPANGRMADQPELRLQLLS